MNLTLVSGVRVRMKPSPTGHKPTDRETGPLVEGVGNATKADYPRR